MKIELIKINPCALDKTITDNFLNKKIHIVCIASNGLSNYKLFSQHIGGLDEQIAINKCDTVNDSNETGTFFPILNLTIVPRSFDDNRNDFGNDKIMRRHMRDCIIANENYIKSKHLVFALEDDGFDSIIAFNTLSEIAKEYKFNHTKKLSFYSDLIDE